MRNKIILFTLLSTLIFITYAHAQLTSSQKAEEIFPILKWLVSTTPYNWYSYLVDLVNSYSVATNLKINQEIKNSDDVYLKFRAPSYVKEPNKRLVLREGLSYQYIKDITDTEINNGYTKFVVPVLQFPTSQKVSFVYFGIYEEDSSISPLTPEKKGSILVITPPLKYTYVPPPPPKITILPVPRVTGILEIKPSPTPPPEAGCPNCVEISYKFKVENASQANPFYLDSVAFKLNGIKRWPFKWMRIIVYGGGPSEGGIGKAYYGEVEVNNPTSTVFTNFYQLGKAEVKSTPPLVNDEYIINVIGAPFSLDDPNYPWEDGLVSFSLTSVTAKNTQGQVVRSTGQDTSETYKIIVPQPKITIIPQLRTQEIREIRPNTTTQIQYAFEVTNVPIDTPFYLNSLTFRVNQQYQWPFKEIQVEVTKSDTTEKWSTTLTATASKPYILTVTFPTNPNPPLTNGTYTVMLKGFTYSPQDKDFPYTNGYVSFRFTSVTAKDINNKIEVKSTGEDVSHTYKIIVPYYPNVTINAKVGSDEYPALVYEKQGNIATLYFTSFTGRFNAIRAGIQLSTTSTLPTRGVTTTGITKTIEVNQDCGGTCPRTYEELVAKFGSPDKWAIPLIRWDWSKTTQYTLNMYMNCSGWIPQINNSDPTKSKSFIFVCSNRKAFGNNFGWNRQLTVRLNWALTGNEKLSYEVFYPEVVKLSLKNILQKSSPALMFKVKR
jgi:hypothetical protein